MHTASLPGFPMGGRFRLGPLIPLIRSMHSPVSYLLKMPPPSPPTPRGLWETQYQFSLLGEIEFEMGIFASGTKSDRFYQILR